MYEPAIVQPRAPGGPFGLDAEIIADIEKDWTRCDQIKLTQFSPIDLTFTEQPLKTKMINGVCYPSERLNQLTLNKSPSRPHSANVTLYSASSPQQLFTSPLQSHSHHRPATAPSAAADPLPNLMENLPKYDTKLLNIIKGIGHPDHYVSHASLNELSDIIESQEKQAVLRDYEEIYIQSVLAQFKVDNKFCCNLIHYMTSFLCLFIALVTASIKRGGFSISATPQQYLSLFLLENVGTKLECGEHKKLNFRSTWSHVRPEAWTGRRVHESHQQHLPQNSRSMQFHTSQLVILKFLR